MVELDITSIEVANHTTKNMYVSGIFNFKHYGTVSYPIRASLYQCSMANRDHRNTTAAACAPPAASAMASET
jgi:hypothetical protein